MCKKYPVTLKKFEEMTGIPPGTVRQWIYERKVPCLRMGKKGGKILVYPDEIINAFHRVETVDEKAAEIFREMKI